MQVLYAPSYVFKVMVRFGTIIEKTSPPPGNHLDIGALRRPTLARH